MDYIVPKASETKNASWEAADWSSLRALSFVYVMPAAQASVYNCIDYVQSLQDQNYLMAGVEDGVNCWYVSRWPEFERDPI